MKNIKFSIIIPSYNVEIYLEECVKSVLRSEYKNFEILLIDDGSTDNTGIICDKYEKEYEVIQCYHKKNGGLSDARNYGSRRATGDYILFVDADDTIQDSALKDLADIINNEEVFPDIVITEMLNTSRMDITEKSCMFDMPNSVEKDSVLKFVFGEKRNTFPAQQYVCKKTFLLDNNLFFEAGYLHEDNGWTPQAMIKAETYRYYNKVWYLRRINREGSITGTPNSKRAFDSIELTKKNIESGLFDSINQDTREIMYNTMVESTISGMIDFCRYNKHDQKKLVRLIKENYWMYQYVKTLKYKLFIIIMRIIGIKNALLLLSKVKQKR